MVEPLPSMPPGTLGFRVAGALDRDGWRTVVLPPVEAVVRRGEALRLLVVADAGLAAADPMRLLADAREVVADDVRDRARFHRSAIATDVGWVRQATSMLGWLAPGEVRLFAHGEVERATAWVAG
jgi:hypothetical protein